MWSIHLQSCKAENGEISLLAVVLEFNFHSTSLGLLPIWTLRLSACFLYNSHAGLRPPEIIYGRVATLDYSRSAHHYQANFHQ